MLSFSVIIPSVFAKSFAPASPSATNIPSMLVSVESSKMTLWTFSFPAISLILKFPDNYPKEINLPLLFYSQLGFYQYSAAYYYCHFNELERIHTLCPAYTCINYYINSRQ